MVSMKVLTYFTEYLQMSEKPFSFWTYNMKQNEGIRSTVFNAVGAATELSLTTWMHLTQWEDSLLLIQAKTTVQLVIVCVSQSSLIYIINHCATTYLQDEQLESAHSRPSSTPPALQ